MQPVWLRRSKHHHHHHYGLPCQSARNFSTLHHFRLWGFWNYLTESELDPVISNLSVSYYNQVAQLEQQQAGTPIQPCVYLTMIVARWAVCSCGVQCISVSDKHPSCYFYKLALCNTVWCIYMGSKYSQAKPARLTQDTRTLGNKMVQPAHRCSRWLPPPPQQYTEEVLWRKGELSRFLGR